MHYMLLFFHQLLFGFVDHFVTIKIIYSTVLSKSLILLGMAEINIAEINTLEKKSKKDLILLFFKREFFIILL